MRIDSSGRVGLNETGMSSYDGDADDLVVKTGGNTGITLRTSSTGTGSIFFADGISGAERYQGTIRYFHNGNVMTFGTSATERMRINSNGNIGINYTSAAPHTLTVKGTISRLNSSNIQVVNLGVLSEHGQLTLNQSGGVTRVLLNTSGADSYINAGNFGIGITGPQSKFHVSGGDIRIDNNQQYLAETAGGGVIGVAKMDGSDNLLIGDGNLKIDVTGTTARLTIDSSGNTTVAGTLTVQGATVNIGNTLFLDNNEIWAKNSNNLNVKADGVIRIQPQDYGTAATFDSSGNTTLAGDLTVAGGLTIQGTTTTLDTQNLLVEDKNIILGNVSSPSDTTADGGGITLKGSSDYTINWLNSNNSWNFNQGIVVGQDGTGYDVTFHSATSGRAMSWDSSARKLNFGDLTSITVGAGDDLTFYHNAHSYIESRTNTLFIQNTQADGQTRFQADDGSGSSITDYLSIDGGAGLSRFSKPVHVGVDDTGHDVKFFGATSGRYLLWDESANALTGVYDLKIADSRELQIGGGNDLRLYHSHPHSYIVQGNSGGSLYIRSHNTIQLENSSGQDMLTAEWWCSKIISWGQLDS